MPEQAEEYIFLQRTAYPKEIERILAEMAVDKNHKFYGAVRNAVLGKVYFDDIYKEFETFKNYLPEKLSNILDIGCGIAGIDVLLNRFYESKSGVDKITLLDKEGCSEIYYNFETEAAHYNSLDLAKDFLRINGVKSTLETINITEQAFPNGNFDLVISLISWGFHYPVSTYLDVVYEHLADGGILILDVRKNQNQERILQKKFGTFEMIYDFGKANRILVKK